MMTVREGLAGLVEVVVVVEEVTEEVVAMVDLLQATLVADNRYA